MLKKIILVACTANIVDDVYLRYNNADKYGQHTSIPLWRTPIRSIIYPLRKQYENTIEYIDKINPQTIDHSIMVDQGGDTISSEYDDEKKSYITNLSKYFVNKKFLNFGFDSGASVKLQNNDNKLVIRANYNGIIYDKLNNMITTYRDYESDPSI